MAKVFNTSFNAFNSGEISPFTENRLDVGFHKFAALTLENFLLRPQGPAEKRGGSLFVTEVKFSNKFTRLLDFIFNVDQAYVIEAGELYFRFHLEGSTILDPAEVEEVPYEIVTTYLEEDLANLQYVQSGDTVYIVHPKYPPRQLLRLDHDEWVIEDVPFTANPFNSEDNYPSCVTFHQQRSVWAGTHNSPQKVWFSKTVDFTNMTEGTEADSAMSYVISSEQVNSITWLVSTDILLIGTLGGEFKCSASTLNEAITPTNISVQSQSNVGAASLQPVNAANSVFFVDTSNKSIYEAFYDGARGAYVSQDVTQVSAHIAGEGVTELAYQITPYTALWCTTKTGHLAVLTRVDDLNVKGWCRVILGGTDVFVESVSIIPESRLSSVWIVVKRTINGNTVRYIEQVQPSYAVGDIQKEMFYVDSGLKYVGDPVLSLSGLDHLEGETVASLTDGGTHAPLVVVNGEVTFDFEVTAAVIGLPYIAKLTTNRVEFLDDRGTSEGLQKRIISVTLFLKDSLGVEVGTSETRLDEVPFRSVVDTFGEPPPLFTGSKEVFVAAVFEILARVYLKSTVPQPLTVSGVTAKTTVGV